MTLGLLTSGFLLGLVFCATPGAVNTESLRRGARRGFWPALLVQLGSLCGDMVWAAAALSGMALLVQNRAIVLILGICGACFLLRQAFVSFREAARGPLGGDVPASPRGHFLTGAFFSLTNPFAIAFWMGIGAGAATTAHASVPTMAGFLAGFMAGACLWCLFFALLVSAGRRYANARVLRAIDALAGAALSYFGIRLLGRSLSAVRLLRMLGG
jgi:chemosensory pili system protein ChpE